MIRPIIVLGAALIAAVSQGQGTRPDKPLARVNAFVDALVKGNLDEVRVAYDDKALLVGPATLTPLDSKDALVKHYQARAQTEKLLYFHLRQPHSATFDRQTAVVVANYEEGVKQGEAIIETNGKILFVLSGGPNAYKIGAEVIVPNVNSGTYGPMGTAMNAKPWGRFPAAEVPSPDAKEEQIFEYPWGKQLFETTKAVNATFPKGSIDAMLEFADKEVSIWAGDYGPVYILGVDSARHHFADFFRSGKMRGIRAFRPVMREIGGTRLVYFQFEESLDVERQLRRNNGQATYLFRSGRLSKLVACTETSVVVSNIGDPYPVN